MSQSINLCVISEGACIYVRERQGTPWSATVLTSLLFAWTSMTESGRAEECTICTHLAVFLFQPYLKPLTEWIAFMTSFCFRRHP